jgi:hypothetical protein
LTVLEKLTVERLAETPQQRVQKAVKLINASIESTPALRGKVHEAFPAVGELVPYIGVALWMPREAPDFKRTREEVHSAVSAMLVANGLSVPADRLHVIGNNGFRGDGGF